MQVSFKAVVGLAVMLVVPASLAAQWPSHPQQNVPRTRDGKVNMTAPTPRGPDGKPDLSGVWENIGVAPGQPRQSVGPNDVPLFTFFDIGAGFKDGLPLQPWAQELKKKRVADNSKDNPDAWCLPMGNMQFNVHPFPRKMVQVPGLVVILYETHQGIRQIFTDGRTKPTDDPQPWWYGYSTGRWEGDTLVVETTGFRDGGWLDIAGSPLTDAGKTIEKFRRLNVGQMEIEITIDDPKAYTRPFTVKLNQRLMPDNEIMEMVCQENEQSTKHFSK